MGVKVKNTTGEKLGMGDEGLSEGHGLIRDAENQSKEDQKKMKTTPVGSNKRWVNPPPRLDDYRAERQINWAYCPIKRPPQRRMSRLGNRDEGLRSGSGGEQQKDSKINEANSGGFKWNVMNKLRLARIRSKRFRKINWSEIPFVKIEVIQT